MLLHGFPLISVPKGPIVKWDLNPVEDHNKVIRYRDH